MNAPQLDSLTIAEIHHAFEQKIFSPVELTNAYLKAARSNQLNAYITLCEDRALKQANAANAVLKSEGKVPRQKFPLFGIPIAIKDILTVQGVRTTCASKILENYVPPYTATLVERLESAGSVTLGKLNMDEFAMGGSNENSAYGPVDHPTHPGRVPGGSSGGSAAAVRAGLCAAAIGTDTGGSIRLPASYCGVVGAKGTYGRISRYGLVAFASSLDQAGPLARNVQDAALLMDVMSGHDPLDSTSLPLPRLDLSRSLADGSPLTGLKIGVPQEYEVAGLQPEVEQGIQSALKEFEKQGAKLVPISLPHTQHSVAVYYVVAVSEASSNLSRFDGVRFGSRTAQANEARNLDDFYENSRILFGAEVKRRIILGTFALSSGYSEAFYRKACLVRRLIAQDFDQAFEKVDLIAGPVAPTTAFKRGEKADPLQMYLNDIFTIPANLAGLPALSLPCGVDSAGLPIGLHLVGRARDEQTLFRAAHALERGLA